MYLIVKIKEPHCKLQSKGTATPLDTSPGAVPTPGEATLLESLESALERSLPQPTQLAYCYWELECYSGHRWDCLHLLG